MKIIKSLLTVLLLSFMVSCSSDDSNVPVNTQDPVETENPNNPNPENPENPNPTEEDSFTFKVDGQVKTLTQISARITDHIFLVYGYTADEDYIELTFNKSGNLGSVGIMEDGIFKRSYYYDRADHFDFNMTIHDESNHRIGGSFSGKVYEDQYNLSSGYSEIEGDFNITYEDSIYPISKLTTVINGQNWMDSGYGQYADEGIDGFYYQFQSDDSYAIGIRLKNDVEVGTYSINQYSDNGMIGGEYDSEYDIFGAYYAEGTLTITSKIQIEDNLTIYEGTFDIIAYNTLTGENLTVTGGSFKILRSY